MQNILIRPPFKQAFNLEIEYPDLPVSKRIEEIRDIIYKHQVVIISGATGSGKTTQLPKICLELGRGTKGLIAHTQPRRIAATSIEKRINQELGLPNGINAVSHQIRFQSTTSKDTYIKVMTDGILLAEINHDKYLRKYDTIILDEAHERSLNIDFLLGYIKKILPKRPDLKIIITSATIDTQSFSKHFNHAPIIEIEGKTYPVNILYRSLEDINNDNNKQQNKKSDDILNQAIIEAIDDLQSYGIGDVLIFLAGEREIKDVANALYEHQKELHISQQKIILPLYSRLSITQQELVFKPSGQQVRIILATNVAETSLTVPRIKYVIDSGLARIKRYSYRQKIDQLSIEEISQASANQRSGRCGRISEGICIRLYSQANFNNRHSYTQPEILRSSLANVILKMTAMNLGNINDFDFIQKPSTKAVHDGMQILLELGAISHNYSNSNSNSQNILTNIGKTLAGIPVDVRVGRMLIASQHYNCVKEMLIIASSFGIQDVREFPNDPQKQNSAKIAHAKFKDINSGFNEKLLIWNASEKIIHERKSWNEVKNWCSDNFISFLRLREWREIHAQLLIIAQQKKWNLSASPDNDKNNISNTRTAGINQIEANIHKAILSGLITNIGNYQPEKQIYAGVYGLKFSLHPSNNIDKKKPNWIIAGEIIETNKIYARTIAKIDVKWIEETAEHLLKKNITAIAWHKNSGQVMASENANLYGLPIYTSRNVQYIPRNIDIEKYLAQNPDNLQKIEKAREIFIRHALVYGEINTKYEFLKHNLHLIRDMQSLENKSRRQDILVDDEVIEAFYSQNIPKYIYSEHTFNQWFNQQSKMINNQSLLYLTPELITQVHIENPNDLFPKQIEIAHTQCRLSYRFEVGHALDGITLNIPLIYLNQLDINRCDWLVKGMLKEKIIALIKTLPQKQRKNCVPVPQYAQDFLDRNEFAYGHLLLILIEDINNNTAANVNINDFKPEQIPCHLHMSIKIIDEYGQYLDAGKDIAMLKSSWGGKSKQIFSQIIQTQDVNLNALNKIKNNIGNDKNIKISTEAAIEPQKIDYLSKDNITAWTFGELPQAIQTQKGQLKITGYPALVEHSNKQFCCIKIFDTHEQAHIEHIKGIKRLFALQIKENIKKNLKDFSNQPQLGVNYLGMGNANDLYEQIIDSSLCMAFLPKLSKFGNLNNMQILSINQDYLPKNNQEFSEFLVSGKQRFGLIVQEIKNLAMELLKSYANLIKKLNHISLNNNYAYAAKDMLQQLNWLISKDFLIQHSYEQLKRFPIYLQGIELRIEKLKYHINDQQYTKELTQLQNKWQNQLNTWQKQGVTKILGEKYLKFLNLPYMWQELRIVFFAQNLRTAYPISIKRLDKIWLDLTN